MMIDWKASKLDWIAQMRGSVIPRLQADARFVNSVAMVERFEAAAQRWNGEGDFRPVIHDGNEIVAAAELLRDMRPGDRLFYEPRLLGTKKSVDFKIEWHDGGISWVDMKTVAPLWQDNEAASTRIEEILSGMPANHHVICSPAIGKQWINARWSFVARAVELEAKIGMLSELERGPVRLLLCSNGAWHEDDLEDFADFYRSGSFHPDDWAQNAVAQYMAERGISFNRSITGFIYLERGHEDCGATKFSIDVKGPRLI